MKVQRKIKVGTIICAMAMVIVSTSQSFASTYCYNATITRAENHEFGNATLSDFRFTATCSDTNAAWGDDRQFYVQKNGSENAVYATLLTAIASDKKVRLKIAGDGVRNSLLEQIGILP